MNIYTFKLSKKTIVAAILCAALLVALLILLIPGKQQPVSGQSKITVKSPEDCVSYLRELGYETETEAAVTKTVTIPRDFDPVYESYNAMQQECGFDLRSYRGKEVRLTTFPITNYPGEEEVLADVLVYQKKIIGGAIYTASVDGFMTGLQPMAPLS